MKLLTAAVALAALVLLLPLALPLCGLLALCGGWPPRDKPAVRTRRRTADKTAFGEVLLVMRQGRRLFVVPRTRREHEWRAVVSLN